MSMTLNELYTMLAVGPLSNLSMSKDNTIREIDKAKVISYTNNGLMRLYSRFVLKEKEVVVQMMEGITSYYLMKRFSQAHCHEEGNDDPLYIMDLLNPFEEDVIKVLEVRDTLGRGLTLNDTEDPTSIFTPSPLMIQVPTVIDCSALGVNYQAKHKKLEPGINNQMVELPDTLHEALTDYIAYQVYSHMNGQDNAGKSQEHLNMFEAICNATTDMDLVSQSVSTTSSVFSARGWI